jgi:DNA repair exonuclease SbcCD ATPase subunit
MLVALGFVAALMVGLLVIRGLWSYAVGLGRRRVERRAPSHIAELKADRDRLKAEFAMQGRRLQLRLDDLKTRMAEQMAEASRNRNRIEQLASELGRRDEEISKRDAEIEALRAQAESLERELTERTEMTQAARDDLRAREDEVADLRAQLLAAQSSLGEPLKVAEGSRTSGTGMAAAFAAGSDLTDSNKLNEAELRLRKRIDELNALTRQIDDQRRDLSFQHKELNTLREQIDRSRQIDEAAGGNDGEAQSPAQTDDPAVSLSNMETVGNQLEQQILEAEKETENLTRELAELDEIWNKNMALFEDNPAVKSAAAKADDKAPDAAGARGKSKTKAKSKTARAAKAGTAKSDKKPAGRNKTAAGKSRARSAARKTAAAEPSDTSGGTIAKPESKEADNVISLAHRIRALQGDLGKKS